MSMPKATIGIACFNAKDTIGNALESALEQQYDDYEILVVDDGSTDGSIAIIDRYIELYSSKIRLIAKQNRGAGHTYNTIIDNAEGEFVCFNDDDDTSHPTRLRKTVDALMSQEDDYLCFVDRTTSQDSSRIIPGIVPTQLIPERFEKYMLDALCFHLDADFYRRNRDLFSAIRDHGARGSAGTGVMTARTALLRAIRFDEHLRRFGDTEFNLRAARLGVGALGVEEVLLTQGVTTSPDKSTPINRDMLLHAIEKNSLTYDRHRVHHPYLIRTNSDELSPPSELPFSSVVLLTFNCEDTISRTIRAVSRLRGNFEVIVVDDCSTDSTCAFLDAIVDSRFKIIRNPENKGAGYCRTLACSMASGEFIMFQDDDDIPHRDRLLEQISQIIAYERRYEREFISLSKFNHFTGAGYVGTRNPLGAHGPHVMPNTLYRLVWHVILQHSDEKELQKNLKIAPGWYALGTSLMAGRSETFRKHGFSAEQRRMQDLEFLLRYASAGGHMVATSNTLADIHSTSSPDKSKEIVHENLRRLVLKHRNDFVKLFGFVPESLRPATSISQQDNDVMSFETRVKHEERRIWDALVRVFD